MSSLEQQQRLAQAGGAPCMPRVCQGVGRVVLAAVRWETPRNSPPCCTAGVCPPPPPHTPLDEAPGRFPAVILVFQGEHPLNRGATREKEEGKGTSGSSPSSQPASASPSTTKLSLACEAFLHQVSFCMSGIPTTLTLKGTKRELTAQSHDYTIFFHHSNDS